MAITLKVNYSTAQRYIQQLAEVGLLQEVAGQARNRVYRSEAILRAIDEPLSNEKE